jgi:hypothetical protein
VSVVCTVRLDIDVPTQADWWTASIGFAQESFESRRKKINSRRQSNKEKILHDIASGTVAEFAAHHWLTEQGLQVSEPDLAIYTAKQKSFGADLVDVERNMHFHVKTYSDPKWASWVFQAASWDTDPLITKPHPNHYLVLTHTTKSSVQVQYVIHQPNVVGLFEDPVVWRLRSTKQVLYPKTLDANLCTPEYQPPEFL